MLFQCPTMHQLLAQFDETRQDYFVRSWNSFKEAIPNNVAPVNTMMKITAPNEKRVASDIYESFFPARRKAPSARIDGTHTPT
jgi:hypothetical protein